MKGGRDVWGLVEKMNAELGEEVRKRRYEEKRGVRLIMSD